jgi:hypothetical protein
MMILQIEVVSAELEEHGLDLECLAAGLHAVRRRGEGFVEGNGQLAGRRVPGRSPSSSLDPVIKRGYVPGLHLRLRR